MSPQHQQGAVDGVSILAACGLGLGDFLGCGLLMSMVVDGDVCDVYEE